ncbi:MAG: hypothetical protein Q9209_006741 [Squamulea sp. 1 TL-2023]
MNTAKLGRAEGAGALYLKRLGDAIRDGDPIRGVIRSSAVNINGKVAGMGITHPSVRGQEEVVRMAYEKKNLDQSKTAYLECHGTGTPVGDPIEARAVANAMNDTRSPDKPLLIGAVKANIGHSEAASGILAVMKAALVTENGVIPGVAGLKNLNPEIDEIGWNVKVQRDTAPWPDGFESRRAGVSSLGYGGTYRYVIVEDVNSLFPWYQHGKPINGAGYDNSATRPFMVALSAHDKPTLQRHIAAHAKVTPYFYMADVAHTLNTKRTKFAQRAFTIARQGNEREDFALSSFRFASVSKKSRPDLAFISTGQGAQWIGMGVEAIETFPSFRETIRALDTVLQRLEPPATWSLEEALLAPVESNTMHDAEVAQPICSELLEGQEDILVACENSPASVTLSGTFEAIKQLKTKLDKCGTFARELKTGKAYHSPQMAKVAPMYNSLLSTAITHMLHKDDMLWRQPKTRMISSATGEEFQGDHMPVQYWSQNLRSRVLFDNAIATLARHPNLQIVGKLIKIGPHSALAGPLKQILTANSFDQLIYIPTLVRNSNSTVQLLKTAGELFVRDYPLDVKEVNAFEEINKNAIAKVVQKPQQLVDLPPYQWNYEKKYWAEARFSQEQRHLQFPRHDLLGSKIAGLSDRSLVWRNVLSHRNIPWLRDHCLGNEAIFPAAAHMSLAIKAVRHVSEVWSINFNGITLRDIEIKQALIILIPTMGLRFDLG